MKAQDIVDQAKKMGMSRKQLANFVKSRKKTVLVYDWGACIEHAITIARAGHRVLYYSPWQGEDPSSNDWMVGCGIPEIEKVTSFWDHVDEADVIAFFSTNQSDIIEYLRAKGYKVFGAGKSEIFEADRWFWKEALKKMNLPVNPVVKVKGLDRLHDHLEGKKDKYIKTSYIRGDMETYHYVDEKSAEPWFDDLGKTLGVRKNDVEFLVEDPIDGIEIGYDGYVIDGQYPKKTIYGYEYKDKGYIGKAVDYEKEHPAILKVNEALAPLFKRWKARTLFHTELRITKDGTGFATDPAMRAGRPPSEIELEMFENFDEIVIKGAEGIMVEPKIKSKYGAVIYFESEWLNDNWLKIDFPEDIRRWVKMFGFCKIDGHYYAVPKVFKNGGTACAIVALGDSPEECFKLIKERIEKVEAYKLNKTFDTEHLEEYLKQGEHLGINI